MGLVIATTDPYELLAWGFAFGFLASEIISFGLRLRGERSGR